MLGHTLMTFSQTQGFHKFFTSDLVQERATPPTSLINEHVETMSSQTIGELGDLHTMQVEFPSTSSIIQQLAPKKHSIIYPSTIVDSSKQIDDNIVVEGPTSSGAPNISK